MAEAEAAWAGASPGLLLFPCNGNAIEALHCVSTTAFTLLGFIDDDPRKHGRQVCGHPVHGREALAAWPEAKVLAVPGSPLTYQARGRAIDGLGLGPARWARLIHPTATISPLATLGYNVLVMAGVVITSNAVIGNHVCVLPNTVIHHDVEIDDLSLIGSNVTIAGATRVGSNCYIGSGSSIMNGLEIGDGTLVGLGSTVIRNTPRGARVAGSPARPLSPAGALRPPRV